MIVHLHTHTSMLTVVICMQQAVCEQRHQQRQLLACREVQRQSAARARRYYQEYELGLKARLQKKRTREEQVIGEEEKSCLEAVNAPCSPIHARFSRRLLRNA